MSEVGVEIVKTEEAEESGIKYLNINMSDDEVKRNPDVVRLCADAGILEYVKPKADVLDEIRAEIIKMQTYKLFEDAEKLVALDEVLQIIDKYRAESEEK